MYHLNETIAAVSSAGAPAGTAGGTILRVSGAEAFSIVGRLAGRELPRRRGVYTVRPAAGGVACEAAVYLFPGPHSYTGEDLAEIHLTAPAAFTELIYARLIALARPAGPGEFTWRAYLNGRMDLSQAEAVAQIVSGANVVHLAASQRLLAGGLAQAVGQARADLLEILSHLEAGMDFSEEAIEFISTAEARERIRGVERRLRALLEGPVAYERMIDLPAVGIAGAVNAGKSTLLNALLGRRRSLTSDRRATTRDVLSEVLHLEATDCILFDCAGLAGETVDTLDAMVRQAARAALESADLAIFCVNIAKEDLSEDEEVFRQICSRPFIAAATQCDRVGEGQVRKKLEDLGRRFGGPFLPVSAQRGEGLEALRQAITGRLLSESAARGEAENRLALNRRHRQILEEAVKALGDCADETGRGNTEIAAMLLRGVRGRLGGVEHEPVDESVLEQIFSRFCIGK